MARFHVRITGRDYEAMADLIRKYHLTIAPATTRKLAKGAYKVDAYVSENQIEILQAAGYAVKRFENVDEIGRARMAEVRGHGGVEERMPEGRVLPVKERDQYLNVQEVESALAALAGPPNETFIQLVKLPHRTWEGRECHAIKIADGSGGNRTGLYLLGGVHAREWGSCDILINLAQALSEAYRNGTGITIGSNKFSASQINTAVKTKDLYIFPQANPDGRNFSMTQEPMWRKNRRPANAGENDPNCIGVDINRNYDFMWEYPKFFDGNAPVMNSQNPCDPEIYIGPGAESEPETKNVVWIFDTYPNIRYFIDLHSHAEDILYNWGDDVNQTQDPQMNFRNPAFDGKRGIVTDRGYKEFIEAEDKVAVVKLAKGMQAAIKTVRGRNYRVMQSVGLYPTAGTSDDYAFSRHLLDGRKAKVYSFTIEWGSDNTPTAFHPAYAEMKQIIRENTAALLNFCINAK